MRIARVLLGLTTLLLAAVATAGYASAFPSSDFYEVRGNVFDDWEICRTRAFGADGFYQITETGFRPVIAFQSLGQNADLAYSLGELAASEFPDPLRRAEAIFHFVRDRVRYTSDIDRTGYAEFAQNADELATAIVQDGTGRGDCEDMTMLLAVMYRAAGFRCAVVLVPGHTALLVHLPDYNRATAFFELDGEPGWIWAEATGRNNPLGWAPAQYLGVDITAYEVSAEVPAYQIPAGTIAPLTPPPGPATAFTVAGEGDSYRPFPFLSVIGVLLFIPFFRRALRR
ncbi:MAG: transglutaminase domain-containing protein [Dehalococcoidia bacterium]|nr:transglutaminase domain-containing protein [Dehalococcoidia bacterium]